MISVLCLSLFFLGWFSFLSCFCHLPGSFHLQHMVRICSPRSIMCTGCSPRVSPPVLRCILSVIYTGLYVLATLLIVTTTIWNELPLLVEKLERQHDRKKGPK